jgi:hypothetical protein
MRQAPTPYTTLFLRKSPTAHERRREDEGGEYYRQLHLMAICELVVLLGIPKLKISSNSSCQFSKTGTSLKLRYIFKCSRPLDYGRLYIRYAEAAMHPSLHHISKISAVIFFLVVIGGF